MTREDAETVAESRAFAVLAHYGMDTGSYSVPYVAQWAEDKAVLRRNLAEVQGIAACLIAEIEEAERAEKSAGGRVFAACVHRQHSLDSRY